MRRGRDRGFGRGFGWFQPAGIVDAENTWAQGTKVNHADGTRRDLQAMEQVERSTQEAGNGCPNRVSVAADNDRLPGMGRRDLVEGLHHPLLHGP
jgi:hypothetical protein